MLFEWREDEEAEETWQQIKEANKRGQTKIKRNAKNEKELGNLNKNWGEKMKERGQYINKKKIK